MAALASDWLRHFSTFSLEPTNGIRRNLTGSKISMSYTKFEFFGSIGKSRWPPWLLIGWEIFDFSSETAEWNSTTLSRKKNLNVLYQVYVFRVDRKNKMASLASDWLRHFRLLLWNCWTEFNETCKEARSQRPLPSLCFSGRSEKTRPWPLIGWVIFDFSSETTERNSQKLDRKQDLNILYQVCVFRADRENKMATLASDWLRHFWLLLWNHSTEFNETWQEARPQSPLQSSCFSGLIGKTRWPPWPLMGWGIFDFSKIAEQNSTKLDRKKDLNVVYQVCVFWADRKNKMAALANPSKRWHIVLRCTICGPLGLLFGEIVKFCAKIARNRKILSECIFVSELAQRFAPWYFIALLDTQAIL